MVTKNSVENVLTIKLPCRITADDYHEYKMMVELLSSLSGQTVKYRELDEDETDEVYEAVLFVQGHEPSREQVAKLA